MIEHLQVIEHQLRDLYIMIVVGFFLIIFVIGYMTNKIVRGGR